MADSLVQCGATACTTLLKVVSHPQDIQPTVVYTVLEGAPVLEVELRCFAYEPVDAAG